jgi:hypothetical protein
MTTKHIAEAHATAAHSDMTDDEKAALKELFELVDMHLAPNSTPASSLPKEAWAARACLKRLERVAATLRL